MIPRRNRDWVVDDADHIKILIPRYGSSPIGRWIARSLGRSHISVKLDAVGSAVWSACDGFSTVGQIAIHLEQRFGDQLSPFHDRLASYFHHLERGRMIRWKG